MIKSNYAPKLQLLIDRIIT